MMERHLRHREADADALGAGGQRGREGDGIDVGADAVEVMLGEPQHLHAQLVAEPPLTERLLDDAPVLVGVGGGGEQEVAELHARSSHAAISRPP
jgi:hypothetical protein